MRSKLRLRKAFLAVALSAVMCAAFTFASVAAVPADPDDEFPEEIGFVSDPEGETKGIDIVLVLDCSLSMPESDPNKVTLQGANLLSDILSRYDSVRLGAVMFAGEIHGVMEIRDVSGSQNATRFQDELMELYKPEFTHTDSPRGMGRALDLLEDDDVGNAQAIVLLTDGVNEPRRSETEMNAEQENLIESAAQNDIPIYTIALKLDQKQNLQDIAADTEGRFYDVSQEQGEGELVSIFGEIIGDLISKSDNTAEVLVIDDSGSYSYDVTIPDDYVDSAQMTIVPYDTTSDIVFTVYNPSGRDVTDQMPDVSYQSKDTYKNIHLSDPVKGDWTITIEGQPGAVINVNLIYDYDLTPVASQIDRDKVEFYLTKNGTRITDPDLYAGISEAFLVVESPGTDKQRLDAAQNDYVYVVDVSALADGEYNAYAEVRHNNFQRVSPSFTLSRTVNVAPTTETTTTTTTTTAVTTTSAPVSSATSRTTSPPPNPNPNPDLMWIIIAVVGTVVLIVLIILAVKMFGKKGGHNIPGEFKIEISNSSYALRTVYANQVFSSPINKISLLDLFSQAGEMLDDDATDQDQAGKIIIEGGSNDHSLQLFSKDKSIMIDGGQFLGKYRMMDLENNDRITIELSNHKIVLEPNVY